jgi:hypothetical protein
MDNNSDCESILLRLQKVTGTKTDSALADVLNIKPQSVVAAKKRRQIPPWWIVTVAKKFQVSADWLFFGYRATGTENVESHVCSEDMQKTLEEQNRRIEKLERQLAELKDETIRVYRLAVELMQNKANTA